MDNNKFKLGEYEVFLDDNNLRFDEHTVNNFMSGFSSKYKHYSELHSLAQASYDRAKADYENTYDSKFAAYKETGGCSDKLAEAKARSDYDVRKLQDNMLVSQHKARRLSSYLRSMDKAHESAREFCYNLRKELDKMYLPGRVSE